MSERVFRVILGTSLLAFLYLGLEQAMMAYIALLLFEGVTNWRIPILVSRARFGNSTDQAILSPECARIPFDAERMLRIIVAGILIVSYLMYKEYVWFIPWFVGVMLLIAGITNICPMVIGLRWAGFR